MYEPYRMNDHPSFRGDCKSYRNDPADFSRPCSFSQAPTYTPTIDPHSLSQTHLPPTFSPSTNNPPSTHDHSPEPTNPPPNALHVLHHFSDLSTHTIYNLPCRSCCIIWNHNTCRENSYPFPRPNLESHNTCRENSYPFQRPNLERDPHPFV